MDYFRMVFSRGIMQFGESHHSPTKCCENNNALGDV